MLEIFPVLTTDKETILSWTTWRVLEIKEPERRKVRYRQKKPTRKEDIHNPASQIE